MDITDAVLILGFTIIQKPEKRAGTFLLMLALLVAFNLVHYIGINL